MSGIYGADVEQLRQLGRDLAQQAEQLELILGRLSTRIDVVHWFGPDADRFRESWQSDLSPKLRSASRNLADAGGASTKNAADQEAVSGGSGGSGSAGGGEFGGGRLPSQPDLPPMPRGYPIDDPGWGDDWGNGRSPETLPYLERWGSTMTVPLADGYFPPVIEAPPMPLRPMTIDLLDVLPRDMIRIPEPAPRWLGIAHPAVEPDYFVVPTPFEPDTSGHEWLDGIALKPDGEPKGYVGRSDNGEMFLVGDGGTRDVIHGLPKFTAEDWGLPSYAGPTVFRIAEGES